MVNVGVICYFNTLNRLPKCTMPPAKPIFSTSPDILIHARWIAQVHNQTLLEQHSLAVHQGRIQEILPTATARERYTPLQTVELSEHILIPGLINTHTHAAMSLMRGLADDLPLMTWLHEHIWPAEARHLSPRFVLDGTRLACAEMMLGGISCFNDMYFFPHDAALAASSMGMRAVIGILVMEFPTPYASDAEDYLAKGLNARDSWVQHPLLHFALAPHAPYTVSDASFERIHTLAAQLQLPLHIHIHETADELQQHAQQHGCRPLERLARLGMLSPQTLGVHGVHLNDSDLELLARHACSLAHCPTSNLKLGSGIAPLTALLAHNINTTLGTDGAASNNRLDMFQEMRLASLLAKGQSTDASAVPAWQALQMATLNGARALGLEQQIGSLEAGKQADICAVQLTDLSLSPCYNPISHLINCASREQVTHLWIQGKCCVFDKSLQQEDEVDLKNAVCLWQNKLGSSLWSGNT